MDSIYAQLCQDHSNLQRVLDAFEQLLADMVRADRDPATLELMLEALDYIATYPEKWHHPVEDFACELLLGKAGVEPHPVLQAREEHNRLAEQTRRMKQLFYTIANDCAVERDQLVGAARQYLAAQRAHILMEQHCIFPLLERHLDQADWEQVAEWIGGRRDPLFGPALRDQYDAVQRYVSEGRDTAAVS